MYYPITQFYTGEHGDCDPLHYHSFLGYAVSTELGQITEPEDPCGFDLVSKVPKLTIEMTQPEIDAWNEVTGFTIEIS